MYDSGSFIYQKRSGSRVLSTIVIAIALLLTFAARSAFNNGVVTILTFVASIIVLSIATMPLNSRLFLVKAEYEFTPDDVTIKTKDGTFTFKKADLVGVGCDEAEERRSASSVWKISFLFKASGKKPVELYSESITRDRSGKLLRGQEFLDFGRELKHWYVH